VTSATEFRFFGRGRYRGTNGQPQVLKRDPEPERHWHDRGSVLSF
jgi:hypothetical protein